jgi:hypothetical protein
MKFPPKNKKKKKKKKGEIGVAGATPYRLYGGGRSHPRPLGVVRPPRKAKKKKKKNEKNGFGILGVAGPPPRAWGWLRTPPTGRRGWPKPPLALGPWGWSGHPERPGVASATPIRPVWGGRHPLAKNGVVRPPHFLGKGWLQPPRFLLFFFFFFFNFLLFFKKKKSPKICKTMPFCPKRRRFGQAQNGVVLEWRV